MKSINEFKKEYQFLSNFYPCKIEYKGLNYMNSEAAFQASKCYNQSDKKSFITLDARQAKLKGKDITIIPNWNIIKYFNMYSILMEKFKNPVLKEKLLRTHPLELIEGNHWHDNDWGNCACSKCQNISGKNNLGKILMFIRDNYIKNKNFKINFIDLHKALDLNLSEDEILKIKEYCFKF